MDKKAWREKMLAMRAGLNQTTTTANSAAVCAELLSLSQLQASRQVMWYLPIRGEVDLTPLITATERRGIKVLLPKVMSKGVIEAYYCPQPWQDRVASGSYGILEPSLATQSTSPSEIDIVLVPGVAFDKDLYRLGYGGGYYDRFLALLPRRTLKIGVAYSCQVVDLLPRGQFDCSMDALATEQGLVFAKNRA